MVTGKIDDMWEDIVEATRFAFAEEDIPFDKAVKPSGTLAARLSVSWNYAPAGRGDADQYRVTFDLNNICMVWYCRKFGLDRFDDALTGNNLRSQNELFGYVTRALERAVTE